MEKNHKYYVSYRFKFGKGVCGGVEEIEAPSFEEAVKECRSRHPNVRLTIRNVKDEDGNNIVP